MGNINCQICQRETPATFAEKHHLVPKSKHGKETIMVCKDCGNQVHQLFSIKHLQTTYNTLEALLSNERVQTWIRWISKKKEFGFCMKAKKKA